MEAKKKEKKKPELSNAPPLRHAGVALLVLVEDSRRSKGLSMEYHALV